MLLEFTQPIIDNAEHLAASGDVEAVLESLRKLSLDDFGLLLLLMPDERYPNLSAVLPRMASDEVQRNWTGASGIALLQQSLDFIRAVQTEYTHLTGKGLEKSRILDYGCGYGRLLRLMMRFAPLRQLAGCDPWDESIRICQADGIACRLDVTDYLPQSLPYEPGSIDLAFAFSVFTHTSLKATKTALAALRKVIAPEGVLAITIRPVEYWAKDPVHAENSAELMATHRSEGWVFVPHQRASVDGDVTYGDTSMSFDYLAGLAENWSISGYNRSIFDENQIIVFLRPA